MNSEFTLLILRILALLLIYAFLLAMGFLLWKETTGNRSPHISSLRFVSGSEAGEQRGVLPIVEKMSIGRADNNSLQLEDEFLSGSHARIYFRDPQWWLEDLESKNGTFLNGRRLHNKPAPLETGDMISCGRIQMIFYEHLNTDYPTQKEMN